MPALTKINGKWTEGTPYLKEGGTWKEIGAVTARLNGRWADIAPPEPVKPRTWVYEDFEYYQAGDYRGIKPELRQFFIVGDSFSIVPGGEGYKWVSTPIPGVVADPGDWRGDGSITGTISGGTELTDVMSFETTTGADTGLFRTADGSYIPIKPA